MKLHRNAKLSVKGRELLVERVERAGWSLTQAAEAAGVSDRPARKWLARYRAEGLGGLLDRPSAPSVVANRTDERRVEVIAALRRLGMTGVEIAECLGMALSTVSGILTRIGMGKLGRIGLEPPQRYERVRPGELLHIASRSSAGSTMAPVIASPANPANDERSAATSTPVVTDANRSAGSA
jgi:transposase